jgi:hypothetical protein
MPNNLTETEMLAVLISMSKVINKRLQQLNNRMDELEKKNPELKKSIAEIEFGEGTPEWVPGWLDEVEKAGKMDDLLKVVTELYGDVS